MTSFKEIEKKLEEYEKEIQDFRDKKQKLILEIGQTPFLDAFKQLQKDVPYITSVRWTQYTPHWNDGSECTFGVNGWLYNTEIDGDVYESEDEYENFFRNLKSDKEIQDLEETIKTKKAEHEKLLAFYKEHVEPIGAFYKEHVESNLTTGRFHSSNERWLYDGKTYWGEPHDSSYKYLFNQLEEAKKIKARFSADELKKIQASLKKFGKFMESVPEDLYQGIFGDHVEVIITADGIEVEEYSHD